MGAIYIHSALGFAANIAKMLWGRPRGTDEQAHADARTRRLRKRLGIHRDKILNSTDLRNDLEHFDQRLDNWTQTSTALNISMFNVGPKSMIHGMLDTDRFLEYDPTSKTVRMLDHTIDLNALEQSVDRVLQAARRGNAELNRLLWPHPSISTPTPPP
jgi:hypothetical protein